MKAVADLRLGVIRLVPNSREGFAMNRRKLLLTTARGALLTAFGAVTGVRAQTPIDSRAVLPIPQAQVKSPRCSMRATQVRR